MPLPKSCAHYEAKVGAFKSPEKVHILPELPKGPSGKIQRLYLNEMLYGA